MNASDLAIALSGAVGILISLLFTFIPALARWYYSEVAKDYRGLFMGGIGLLVSVFMYLFACVWNIPIPGLNLTCGTPGIVTVVLAFVSFMVANQTTYSVSPRSPSRKELPLDNEVR